MSEPEAKALLGDLVPDGRVVGDPDAAVAAARELGGPVAVKVVNADLQHKAIVGGVRLDPPDVAAAARDLLSLGDHVLVERLIASGAETLVAVRTDTIVPILVVGTEVLPLPVARGALDPEIADIALRAADVALEHGLVLLELNPVIGGLAVDAVAAIPKQGVPA
jgi:acyl-CoA synthetase (NDP forming)